MTTSPTHPDALLIALAERLDELAAIRDAGNQALEPFYEAHQKLMDDWRADHPRYTADERRKAEERFGLITGLAAAEERWSPEDATEAMDPIWRAIVDTPATTIAGLAAKARAAEQFAPDLWGEDEEDMDLDKRLFRHLIESVTELAERQDAA
jgi:hypothetical protein